MDERTEKVLKKIETIPGREKLYWNIPRTTGNFLNILARAIKAKQVLEIGTSNGYSGIFFAEALEEMDGRLITIESHQRRFQEAQTYFQETGLNESIEQILGHAPEIFSEMFGEKSGLYLKLFKNSQNYEPLFDLIFLDATKLEYASYGKALVDYLRPGGLIVADNAISHGQEMSDYLKLVQEHPQLKSVLLPFDNGLMLSYKTVADSLR